MRPLLPVTMVRFTIAALPPAPRRVVASRRSRRMPNPVEPLVVSASARRLDATARLGEAALASPGNGESTREGAHVVRRLFHDPERRAAHLDGPIDPGDRDLLNVVARQQRLQPELRVRREMTLLDLDGPEDLGPVQLEVVRDVVNPPYNQELDEEMEGAVTQSLEEGIVDHHGLVGEAAAHGPVPPPRDRIEEI